MRSVKAITAAMMLATIGLSACSEKATSANAATGKPTQEETPTAANQDQPKKFDGPFGLKMGLTRKEAEEILPNLRWDEEPNTASTTTVPVQHPGFESYSLFFSEKSGLCAVAGIGKDIESGSTGSEIQTAFDSLDEALTSKYGLGKKYDFSNKRYESPEFWMLYLLQKNRTLAKIWNKETKATLSNDVRAILMRAYASDISTGYINVRYEFNNIDDCADEQKKTANQAL